MLYRTNYGEEQAWQEFKHQFEKYRQADPQVLDASVHIEAGVCR
jgi:hypothetical protein